MGKLQHPFIEIKTESEKTCGGSQQWFPYGFLRKTGCGVIAATDLLLYLNFSHPGCQSKVFRSLHRRNLDQKEYVKHALQIWRHYLPVIPGFGINAIGLTIGINLYFARNRIPLRAVWKISRKKLWESLDDMLARDIPVILSIGPNFPRIWGKQKLNLYIRKKDGTYAAAARTSAHYVTVTGRDGQWLSISSWGKAYYIRIDEYKDYVKKYSNYVVSNLLCIKG